MGKERMADNRPARIAICIPNEGMTRWQANDSQFMFALHLGKLEARNPVKYEFHFGTIGRVLTPIARNRLAQFALEMEADYMLQIDNDMILPSDMFERLFQTMQEENADIVAPLAFMRVPPYSPVIFSERTGYDGITHKPYAYHENATDYPRDSVLECDAVGFGAALIRVSILKKMHGDQWFMSTVACGEDVWFCSRAKKEAHAKIVVDTRVKLGHLGVEPIVSEETFLEHRKSKGELVHAGKN